MKIGKFFSFNGRSSGLEMAIIYIISGISAFISIKLADYIPNQELALVSVGAFFLFVTYMLIAVVVRRFHDMNMSGWNVMWAILPFILPQPDYLPRFITLTMLFAQVSIILLLGACKAKEPNRFG